MRGLLATAILLFACAVSADDQDGLFIGGNWASLDANFFDDEKNSITYRTLEFYGGYRINSWLGFDGRIGLGLTSEDIANDGNTSDDTSDDYTYEDSVQHFEAIYYRPELSNETAKLYALLGLANVVRNGSNFSDGQSGGTKSDSGFSYGAGIGFVINKRFNLNFEYRSLLDQDGAEYSSVGGGVDFRF